MDPIRKWASVTLQSFVVLYTQRAVLAFLKYPAPIDTFYGTAGLNKPRELYAIAKGRKREEKGRKEKTPINDESKARERERERERA